MYDEVLKVPACAAAEPWCDSGTLLDGRGPLGPEVNAPNTLGAACQDGTAGTYHVASSADAIRVLSQDGEPLVAGQTAAVEVTVWASCAFDSERVDLYACSNPTAATPIWEWLGTLQPKREGILFAQVALTAGQQAIRARMHHDLDTLWPADPEACGADSLTRQYDDHDDLVFTAAE